MIITSNIPITLNKEKAKMKKILSLAALALMLCVAACQQGGYKITGTANGGEDGDTVILARFTGRQGVDTLQTTVIKGGKFAFNGTQDTATMCYVIWSSNADPDLSIAAQIALENAAITVRIDTAENAVSEIGGTPANEALTALNKQSQQLNQQGQDIFAVLSDTAATQEAKDAAEKQLDELQEQMLGLYKEFVANNIQNIAGQTYLTEFAPAFDDEFVNTELAAIPEAAMTPELQRTKQIYEKKAATAVGQPFKDIVAATPDGGENSVAEVAKNAKVLLIDFWASWCGPCRQEMPHVKAAYDKYHKQGFEIIGVSLDSEADSWKKAIADLGMTWPQISDLQGWDCAGAKAYSVRAIPATVLIKDGKIVARDLRSEKLAEKVEELLK